jgi:hypothetical protein
LDEDRQYRSGDAQEEAHLSRAVEEDEKTRDLERGP